MTITLASLYLLLFALSSVNSIASSRGQSCKKPEISGQDLCKRTGLTSSSRYSKGGCQLVCSGNIEVLTILSNSDKSCCRKNGQQGVCVQGKCRPNKRKQETRGYIEYRIDFGKIQVRPPRNSRLNYVQLKVTLDNAPSQVFYDKMDLLFQKNSIPMKRDPTNRNYLYGDAKIKFTSLPMLRKSKLFVKVMGSNSILGQATVKLDMLEENKYSIFKFEQGKPGYVKVKKSSSSSIRPPNFPQHCEGDDCDENDPPTTEAPGDVGSDENCNDDPNNPETTEEPEGDP